MAVPRRVARKLLEGAPYHVGSTRQNEMGLQVARACSKHVAWHLRSARSAPEARPYVRTMEREGIVVIPDFFPAAVFDRIRAEYERSRGELPYRTDFDFATQVGEDMFVSGRAVGDPGAPRAIEESIFPSERSDRFPVIHEHLVHNELITAIASGALRRPVRNAPQTSIQIWRRVEESAAGVEVDPRDRPRGEYMLHADTHYPTLKAWLYLNDIDEGNGAFVFVPRSHKLSIDRLRYEYGASIRVARSRADGTWHTVPYGHIRRLGEAQLARVEERHVCGRANTLVVANTSGFHRRGEFTSTRPRETIHLNFRNTEGLLNRLPLPAAAARLVRRDRAPVPTVTPAVPGG